MFGRHAIIIIISIVYKYCLFFFLRPTYYINGKAQIPHLPLPFKSYVFALPYGSHLGFLRQHYVIASHWYHNRNHRGRRTPKSVFIHYSRRSSSTVTFLLYQIAAILDFMVTIKSWRQTAARIGILVVDSPEKMSSYIILFALIQKQFVKMMPAAILDLALWLKMP